MDRKGKRQEAWEDRATEEEAGEGGKSEGRGYFDHCMCVNVTGKCTMRKCHMQKNWMKHQQNSRSSAVSLFNMLSAVISTHLCFPLDSGRHQLALNTEIWCLAFMCWCAIENLHTHSLVSGADHSLKTKTKILKLLKTQKPNRVNTLETDGWVRRQLTSFIAMWL